MKLTRAGWSRSADTHVVENPVIRIRSAANGANRPPRHALEFREMPAGMDGAVFMIASHHLDGEHRCFVQLTGAGLWLPYCAMSETKTGNPRAACFLLC